MAEYIARMDKEKTRRLIDKWRYDFKKWLYVHFVVWINAEEHPPRPLKSVIGCNGEMVGIAYKASDNGSLIWRVDYRTFKQRFNLDPIKQPTHWLPLPGLSKEEMEERRKENEQSS